MNIFPTYTLILSNLTYCDDFCCFSSAGKEKDLETGLSYFGARYYDADLTTGWLSVDPMSDKYPSMSPYNYCAGNPVKLVDPDGRDVWEVDKAGNVFHINDKGGDKMQFVTYSTGKKITYTGNCYRDILSKLCHASYYNGCGLAGSSMAELFLDMANNSDSEWEWDIIHTRYFHY